MGSFSTWHWLIVLLVVMLIFGTKKLRNAGADLGGAVKGFKEGLANLDAASTKIPEDSPHIIEGTATERMKV